MKKGDKQSVRKKQTQTNFDNIAETYTNRQNIDAIISREAISVKIDYIIKLLNEHRADFKEHQDKDDEVAVKVDRLDQNEIRRVWHLRALWTSIIGGFIAWLTHLLIKG